MPCRQVIQDAGWNYFVHRTGHSIPVKKVRLAMGPTSTTWKRRMRDGCWHLFSIERGSIFPQEFGIRSELDVYLSTHDATVYRTTGVKPELSRFLPLSVS